MTFALIFSVFLTGMLFGFALLAYIVFACIKKQDGTLVRTSLGEFLKELGDVMLTQPEKPKQDIPKAI